MGPQGQYRVIIERFFEDAFNGVLYFVLGKFFGILLGMLIPDVIVPDEALINIFQYLFVILFGFRLLNTYSTKRAGKLNDCLKDVEKLMKKGNINQDEYVILREKCLEDYDNRRLLDIQILYGNKIENG